MNRASSVASSSRPGKAVRDTSDNSTDNSTIIEIEAHIPTEPQEPTAPAPTPSTNTSNFGDPEDTGETVEEQRIGDQSCGSDDDDDDRIMSSPKADIRKLKGRENYDEWCVSAKSYLVIRNLWKYCQKDVTKATTAANERVISKIILMVEPGLYSYIKDTKSARIVWEGLIK